CQQAKSNPLTF
nr:immunoglobulin light chain junction region [Macaca mulatta]